MPKNIPIVRMGPPAHCTSRTLRQENKNDSMSEMSLPNHVPAIKNKKRTSMGSEYIALKDVASNLGTYQLNRDAPQLPQAEKVTPAPQAVHLIGAEKLEFENVKKEAELLMNFMTSQPLSDDTDVVKPSKNYDDCALISPSLSFEAQRHFKSEPAFLKNSLLTNKRELVGVANIPDMDKKYQCSLDQGQAQFNITCPSLSLNKDQDSIPTVSVPSQTKTARGVTSTTTPAQLFARPLKVTANANLKSISEKLASNVMNSFLKALEFRSIVWMKSLSKSLNIQRKLQNLDGTSTRKSEGVTTKRRGKKNSTGSAIKKDSKKDLLESDEARVLRSIAYATKSVVVHDVRTTFQVLEQQIDRTSKFYPTLASKPDHRRPAKKRKTSSSFINCEATNYKLSHAINLETRCTISTNNENRLNIILQAPGIIDGTFDRNNSGDIKLVDVTVQLDTDALAQSMEENSRLVIRTAAKENILRPPSPEPQRQSSVSISESSTTRFSSFDSSESVEDEAEQDPPSYTLTPTATPFTFNDSSARYPQAATVTPMQRASSSSSGSDSDDMPPPPPVPIYKNNYVLNPRRVSPSGVSLLRNEHLDSFASPTPMKPLMLPSTHAQQAEKGKQVSMPPPLPFPVSPSPYSSPKGSVASPKASQLSSNAGPSLPALVEVACAAHAHCAT